MPPSDAAAVVLPALLDAVAAEHDAVLRVRQRVAAARSLVTDDRGLLPLAADDVEAALDALEEATRRRCRRLADLDAASCTLRSLSRQVDEPWATMLADHRRGLADTVADVEAEMLDGLLEIAAQVATVPATSLHVVGGDAPAALGAVGASELRPPPLTATDREVALVALSRPLPLALTAFLR